MTKWRWNERRVAKENGIPWLRPFSVAVPWITVLILTLMFYFISGTLTSSEGILFDLPSGDIKEGADTKLVALIMPMTKGKTNRETLVFFDDARYTLGDGASEKVFSSQLKERIAKTGDKTLLVLADRRVSSGELMEFANLSKQSGVKRILFAERKEVEKSEK